MPPLPAPPDRRQNAELTSAPIRHAPAELPAGPSIFTAEPSSDYDRQRTADVRPQATQDAIPMPPVSAPRPSEVHSVPLVTGSAPALTPVATADTPSRAPLEGPAPSAPPRSTPDADLSAPLYSTRIDPRLYTASDTTHGELPLADTQVDDDGREVHVIYHRDGLDAQPA